jgi:voltage-gated potassium channel
MYFIAAGRVRMLDPESEIVLEPGDFFGAAAMLHGEAPSAPFITLAKCRLLKLHAEDFHRIELINPRFAAEIRKRASDPRVNAR